MAMATSGAVLIARSEPPNPHRTDGEGGGETPLPSLHALQACALKPRRPSYVQWSEAEPNARGLYSTRSNRRSSSSTALRTILVCTLSPCATQNAAYSCSAGRIRRSYFSREHVI